MLPSIHRRPKGGQPGAVALWNLKMMTSYAVFVQNTLKLSLALWALASNTLTFSLKRRKNRENFRSRRRRAVSNTPLFPVHGSLSPSEQIPAGDHGRKASPMGARREGKGGTCPHPGI